MRVKLILEVEPEDVDPSDSTKLTAEADERINEVILSGGFSIVAGPDYVAGTDT